MQVTLIHACVTPDHGQHCLGGFHVVNILLSISADAQCTSAQAYHATQHHVIGATRHLRKISAQQV